jgi:hypothetical protein
MTEQEKIQRRSRFYFYLLALIVFVALSYWSGYRMGKTAERAEWIDRITKKEVRV